MVQIQYFFVCFHGWQEQNVMNVIITTQLLANVLPTTTLLTLGGLNKWEKSIKRKSNRYPQYVPGLGKNRITPVKTRKMHFFSFFFFFFPIGKNTIPNIWGICRGIEYNARL